MRALRDLRLACPAGTEWYKIGAEQGGAGAAAAAAAGAAETGGKDRRDRSAR